MFWQTSAPLLRAASILSIFAAFPVRVSTGFANPRWPTRRAVVHFSSRGGYKMSAYVMTCDPVPNEHLPSWMKSQRTRQLTPQDIRLNPEGISVVYWMQRDVRTVDNWALLLASHVAETQRLPLHVVHVLNPPSSPILEGEIPTLETMGTTERHGRFLLGGLQLVQQELNAKDVPLHILCPQSHDKVASLFETRILTDLSPAVIVCDFHTLRHIRRWMEIDGKKSCESSRVPLWQVDAHNVVPVWHAADKRQVGARTLRPRIHKVVQEYLQKFPKFQGNEHCDVKPKLPADFDYTTFQNFMKWDTSVKEIPLLLPGTEAAKKQFETFVTGGLAKYDELRNDPNYNTICSNLSPWLNHGHISFQRGMMAIKKLNKHASGSAAFIEEGLIRRELSDNFLYYTPEDYDQLSCTAEWAQETLNVHASDEREYLYSLAELEKGETHDDLWNAAQLQVVREGGMHGFLRMYWAKKILEWTESPVAALKTAQYFNDKYALDGRDPNGFVGVGWSIMGIHDQGWKEREIFGKIRYMNYNGCKRKFKISDFVTKYHGAAENAIKAEAKHAATKRSQKKRKEPSS